MSKYSRQYNYQRKQSILFQNARFRRYGTELNWVNTHIALAMTLRDVNDMDGEKLHAKHGSLLMLIKHYIVFNDIEYFEDKALFQFYPNIGMFFGSYADDQKSFLALIHDLVAMEFINPHGAGYSPSMRMRKFFNIFERHCNMLFEQSQPINPDQSQATSPT